MSDSHATLYSQIEALHGMGHKDIGLIIFDKHTDYYLTNGSINKMQKRGDSTTVGGSLPLTKATFLGPLVDSGHVKGVGIIGVPDPNGIGRGSYAPTAEFQKQHADKIRVTALAPYARSHWVEKSLLPSLIADEVQFLRQAGVKHIALSLDIDVLRSSFFGYTSMEYSPLGHLVPLAMMDLKNLKPVSEVGIKPFMESLRSVLDIIGDSKKVRHLLPDTISPEDIKHMEHMQRTAVPEAGMPFSFIARSIKLLKAVCEEFGDIEFGVTLEHGNKYFGDITELSGRDYRRRLARLLYKYIQRVFEKNN